MWFAALGDSYATTPWTVALADKLLEGAPAVMALLDARRWPFRRPAREDDEAPAGRDDELLPPKLLRMWKYEYDFTRAESPWAREVPGVVIATYGVPAMCA